MPPLFIYLLKANLALTLFFLAYRFCLRRLTFYRLNRFFLLFGILFSASFPLIDLNSFFQHHSNLSASISYYTYHWNTLPAYAPPQHTISIWSFLQTLFWTGVMLMAMRFIIQLLSLWRIHLEASNGQINNQKIKSMSKRLNPFSFFKNIYINPALHTREELQTILEHEKIHIREWHSLDVLAGELNTIFYWFNPGAWLMKKAICENLEFITDRKMLQSGMNIKAYQYSLVSATGIPYATAVANNFNFAHLKQRIRMMNKKSSSGIHLLRYLLILPLIAIIVLSITSFKQQMQHHAKQVAEAISQNDTLLSAKTDKMHAHFTISSADTTKPVSPPERPRPKVIYIPPAVVKSDKSKRFNNKYDSLALNAIKAKDLNKAKYYAHQSLKVNPDNAYPKEILQYVQQMENYNEKMKVYEQKKKAYEQHHHDSATPKIKVNFTPPKVVKDSGFSQLGQTNSKSFTVNHRKIYFPAEPDYALDDRIIGDLQTKKINPGDIRLINITRKNKAATMYGNKAPTIGVIKNSH